MKVNITVPSMGESVSEGIVAQILKPSGSAVKKDEEVLEIETDKVNQVLYAPEAGVLTLNVKVDDSVKVDQVIGYVDSEAKAEEAPPTPESKKKEAPPAPEPKKEEAAPPPPPQEAKPVPSSEGMRRSPEDFIASLSEEKKAAAPPPPQQAPQERPKVSEEAQIRKRMSGLRRTIAKRLVEVKNQTAMLTTFNEVDMSEIMEIRAREKDKFLKKHDVKLGFMSFFIKACVSALQKLPDVNAFIDGDEIVYNKSYNIGIAVSTDKGLFVPVLRDCDKKSFAELEKELMSFADKARKGQIAIDDLQGGSFTITNGGVFGSLLSTPILNPPQSAILGMHAIQRRPVAVGDNIEIRPMMYLALSYDHRIIDGREAVTFLVDLKESLEKPERLMLYESDDS